MRTAYKIAFVGSHGVGKTTLCYGLAARLKVRDVVLEIVHEVARRCPLPINEKTSLAAQSWILHTQISDELIAAARHPVVICDRSVLDNYAYMALACGRQPAIERFVMHWMKSYDLLFKVPISGAATADGIRDTDEFFMRSIDQLVDSLLAEKRIAVQALPPGERSAWIDLVKVTVLKRPELARLFR